ncbi:MAG TPA: PAS domain S-box protein [Chryseolinea sp.]|nr:PAS domain S-box protein [Chryseolinea sp.]HPM31423.1 PAS domain S-box protein [Chryseolinea sp.]
MKGSLVKVLIVEDDEDDVLLAREYLSRSEHYKFEVSWEPDTKKAQEQMVKGDFDVFLIDYRLGSENGLDLVKYAHDKGVLKPSILLTGQGDLKVDLDASRYGAADYLIKSELNASILERSIRYAVTQSKVVRELDEKEKKYSSLFERSIDPIFLARFDFTLIDLNNSFFQFFGYTRDDSKNFTIREIFAEEEDYSHFYTTLKTKEQIKDFEVELINKDGLKRWCQLNCVFIPDQSSDFCCYQGIIHDITLRKKAEKSMIEAERLSMTGKMARIVAHEIRNPLTNLNLALEHLKDEMLPATEGIRLYSDIIQRNANRIEHLVGEMLNSSKPKELQLNLESVNAVVDETIALAIDRINLKEITLERNFAENLHRILVDKEKVKIALLNIIINAVEAMTEKEGVLFIRTNQQDNIIVISIIDNGKGISADELDKLFEPFFTAKPSGLGLGLTSTKNILDSHNAEILVMSEQGKGTTFNVLFKLAG